MSNVLKSRLPDVDIPLISITKSLLTSMRQFNDNVFLIEHETNKYYKFNQLSNDCLRLSRVWIDIGLKPSQTFGIWSNNCYESLVCILSGIFIGGIAVPIRGNDTKGEVSRVLREREIKFLAISYENLELMKEMELYKHMTGIAFEHCSDPYFVSYKTKIISTEPIAENLLYEPSNVEETVCLILESSGTTGVPKGCMFSHYNLVSLITIGSLPQIYGRTSDDTVSGHSTMAHISGINQLIMSASNGSKLVLHSKFNFDEMCAAIEKHKITALSVSASAIVKLVKLGTIYDISSLKKVICGSAPLPKSYGQLFVDKYPHVCDFRQAFGMTEMTILIAFEFTGSKLYESCGEPTPANQIKVCDRNGCALKHDQIGEICVKGPTLFKGYHNNLNATKQTLDQQSYLKTGDIGYYDSDGHLFIIDRLKQLLKTDGMQVSPQELESILLLHESVLEAAVIAIPHHIYGDIPTAFVVIKHNYKRIVTNHQILQFVNGRITEQKRIRGGVHFIDNIPKTINGKILRQALKEMLVKNSINVTDDDE